VEATIAANTDAPRRPATAPGHAGDQASMAQSLLMTVVKWDRDPGCELAIVGN
jgi:hypothetical protein